MPLPIVKYKAPYIEMVLPLTMNDAGMMYGDLSEKELKVLEFVRVHGEVSSAEIQKQYGLEQKPVSRILAKLKDKSYIESVGQARNTRYRVIGPRQESGQNV